jgi:hypothetical protein
MIFWFYMESFISFTIIDTEIEHSVILNDTKITGIQQSIVDSLIGQCVTMQVLPKRPQALRFLVGDDSQLKIMYQPIEPRSPLETI